MFGKNGQVAREVLRHAGPHSVLALDRDTADLTDPDLCSQLVAENEIDIVLIAAAYTSVDRAEAEPELARQINSTTPVAIAKAAAKRNLPVLHISTDYVFDGSGGAGWQTTDTCNPANIYGSSKRQGEIGILAVHPKAVILRTSWVFSAHSTNFVKTMLRLGKERDGLSIVTDQIGGPTPAADIARTLINLAEHIVKGSDNDRIYHYSGSPDVSWKDFAAEIFTQAGLAPKITGIKTINYPTPAKRPLNSRFDCSRLHADFAIARPNWKIGLTEVLRELGELP